MRLETTSNDVESVLTCQSRLGGSFAMLIRNVRASGPLAEPQLVNVAREMRAASSIPGCLRQSVRKPVGSEVALDMDFVRVLRICQDNLLRPSLYKTSDVITLFDA